MQVAALSPSIFVVLSLWPWLDNSPTMILDPFISSQSYVHRSGRTARQAKEGLSIMLVSGQEVKSFRKVCKALDRGKNYVKRSRL